MFPECICSPQRLFTCIQPKPNRTWLVSNYSDYTQTPECCIQISVYKDYDDSHLKNWQNKNKCTIEAIQTPNTKPALSLQLWCYIAVQTKEKKIWHVSENEKFMFCDMCIWLARHLKETVFCAIASQTPSCTHPSVAYFMLHPGWYSTKSAKQTNVWTSTKNNIDICFKMALASTFKHRQNFSKNVNCSLKRYDIKWCGSPRGAGNWSVRVGSW